jgi:hypothetical protein
MPFPDFGDARAAVGFSRRPDPAATKDQAVMLDQFLLGGVASISNITIHALVMTTVGRATRSVGAKTLHPSLLLIGVMITVVSVLMAAHTSEVLVWSLAYRIVDAAPVGTNLVYFAFVNYTTLGYGDVVPVQDWQLLGPMTAMNGVLLFGWSTAVIFEVLRRTMMHDPDTGAFK